MDDYHKRVESKMDPYEKIRIAPVERKKHEEFEEKKEIKKRKNLFLTTYLFILKKITSLFTEKSEEEKKIYNFENATKKLKEQFIILTSKNVSEDSLFLKNLSKTWQEFIEAYDSLYLKNNKNLSLVDNLIHDINNYYSGQEYSLGFYLKKYGKESWHPFPFMNQLNDLHIQYEDQISTFIFQKEILKQEHKDILQDADASYLQKWIFILDQIA